MVGCPLGGRLGGCVFARKSAKEGKDILERQPLAAQRLHALHTQRTVGHLLLLVLDFKDLGLHRRRDVEAIDKDSLGLSNAVAAAHSLRFHSRIPPPGASTGDQQWMRTKTAARAKTEQRRVSKAHGRNSHTGKHGH